MRKQRANPGFAHFVRGDNEWGPKPVHFLVDVPSGSYVTHTACGLEIHLPGHETQNAWLATFHGGVPSMCKRCRRTVAFRRWLEDRCYAEALLPAVLRDSTRRSEAP